MWVNDAQRDRIFEMIGTGSVTHHRVRNARAEHLRHVAVALILGTAVLWALLRAL